MAGRAVRQLISNRDRYMRLQAGAEPLGASSAEWDQWIEWRNARRGMFDFLIRQMMDREHKLRRRQHEFDKRDRASARRHRGT